MLGKKNKTNFNEIDFLMTTNFLYTSLMDYLIRNEGFIQYVH